MRNGLQKYLFVLLTVGLCALPAFGQGASTGSLSGTVLDPKGAVVAGATVTVKNTATNQEFSTQTNNDGAYKIPTLQSGVYTATIVAAGFKQAAVTDIKIDVGKVSTINVDLEIGSANETVTVVGGGELLQTQSATVGTTLTGRQISDLPTASRDALDLVLAMPGTTTPGRPRTSSVNGLPKGALNITLDGLNVQDNLLKSSDGFFTYIRPRTDAISEVTVSTSTPGAESSAEGAVQIKFVTQGGSNQYHGGLYWYHRNPALNANYWFNNRDLAPDPVTKKAPQQRILLNQPGGKIGGPISIPGLFSGKDRAFFFVNYEEYRLPEKSSPRTRTILSPLAQQGIHRFTTTLPPCAEGQTTNCYTPPPQVTCTVGGLRTCSVNVLAMAAAHHASLVGTLDPTIAGLLTDMRSSLAGVNAIFVQTSNPNLQQATFFNPGGQVRKFPTVRLDFNVAKNHHIENIWNYQQFRSQVDFLNNVDPAFPGFPNFGSQDSNRFSNSTGWRWTVSQNIVNEARFGLTGGTSLFFPQVNPSQFENQGGVSLNINGPGISTATVTTTPSRRNSPVKQFSDTLSWIKGNHSLTFGSTVTRVNHWAQNITVVPTVGFGISGTLAGDSLAFQAFRPLNDTVNQQANAAALYATLVGRINSITRNVRLNEETGEYVFQGDLHTRTQMTEYGFFVQDTWRFRPNITLTGGLRWEIQGAFTPLNNSLARVENFASIYGESGEGNLFMPGTLTGSPTRFVQFSEGEKAFDTQYGNLAPSIGITWSPNTGSDGFWHALMGNSGQTVLRAGFSTAFIREGTSSFTSIFGGNPGGTLSGNQTTGGTPFPLSFGNLLRNGLPAPPPQAANPVTGVSLPIEPVYPSVGSIADSANTFSPDMKTGYVNSWTFSIQRELTSNMVVEIRYVGNRGNDLWRQVNLNEINLFENGFLNEIRLAQQNLLANIAAGRGIQFRYQGPNTGTFPLPSMLGFFSGRNASQAAACTTPASCNSIYTGTSWSATNLTTALNPLNANPVGVAASFANILVAAGNDGTFGPNRIAAGLPANFFLVNPGKRGGAFLFTNEGETTYDGLTLEFRRRFAKGLLVQSSYTFSKALSNMYASNADIFDQPATLREDLDNRRGVTPFDVTHSFKTNFIYELPVGRGQHFFSGASGWVDKLVGGWGFNGNIRVQSGSPFSLGNVQLVGMTAKELQDAVGVYRNQADADGVNRGNVWVLPLDIRQNTFRAFNTAFGSGTTGPIYTQGAPTGRYIAPAGLNCLYGFVGQCGFQNLVLKGPAFFRSDLSIVKRIRFTENTNLELRGEFLNAFNNINFLVGNASNDINTLAGFGAATFGRFTNAYQDISTTNDPGGRLVQLVVRFNF
ncbi:MAG TPA: carboxypeptidase-like regulatory domain-containing protein [Pyrinomonadaceae bacterium]|nr:carboxypeptidase-like regulatory domain-containing protein [Pyrinomonadaceae bacterium]